MVLARDKDAWGCERQCICEIPEPSNAKLEWGKNRVNRKRFCVGEGGES